MRAREPIGTGFHGPLPSSSYLHTGHVHYRARGGGAAGRKGSKTLKYASFHVQLHLAVSLADASRGASGTLLTPRQPRLRSRRGEGQEDRRKTREKERRPRASAASGRGGLRVPFRRGRRRDRDGPGDRGPRDELTLLPASWKVVRELDKWAALTRENRSSRRLFARLESVADTSCEAIIEKESDVAFLVSCLATTGGDAED